MTNVAAKGAKTTLIFEHVFFPAWRASINVSSLVTEMASLASQLVPSMLLLFKLQMKNSQVCQSSLCVRTNQMSAQLVQQFTAGAPITVSCPQSEGSVNFPDRKGGLISSFTRYASVLYIDNEV